MSTPADAPLKLGDKSFCGRAEPRGESGEMKEQNMDRLICDIYSSLLKRLLQSKIIYQQNLGYQISISNSDKTFTFLLLQHNYSWVAKTNKYLLRCPKEIKVVQLEKTY